MRNVYVVFCDKGDWGIQNGKNALASGWTTPQRGNMGEVPEG